MRRASWAMSAPPIPACWSWWASRWSTPRPVSST